MNEAQTIEKMLKKDEEVVIYRLEKWAKESGEKPFYYYGEENIHLSFREFNEMANKIGHNLMTYGINKGDRVSLLLNNAMVTTLAMFGIWKIGAVYCPINYNYRGRLLSYQINDTKPKCLITEKSLIPAINEIKEDIDKICVFIHEPHEGEHDFKIMNNSHVLDSKFEQNNFEQLAKGKTDNPMISLFYSDICNIIYTSGTTGPPKGVVQTYRWMNNYTFYWRKFFDEDDIIINYFPLYHVGGAFFLTVMPTWVGAQIGMWDRYSAKDFWERVQKCNASGAALVDVMTPWLMKADETAIDRYNSLNKVYMQPLPEYHHDFAKRFSIDFIVSGFMQTEAGCGCICIIDELEKGTPNDKYKGFPKSKIRKIAEEYDIAMVSGRRKIKKGFMGRPSQLYDANILDSNDEEIEDGKVGELAFRPRFPNLLFREYFRNLEATQKAFRNLWFHTGDASYKDKEGNYYFVDRIGGAIRVRGEIVSSYLVEDIINKHEKVNLCAVFPIPAEVGDEDDIVLYVVLKPQIEMGEGELQQWVEKQLPKFMWPKYIRFIDDLPKTPTSKIEKYKLREKIKEELGRK